MSGHIPFPSAPTRRELLAMGAMATLAGCARGAASKDTLFVGDQRGGQKVVLEATGALTGVPYHIEWSSFPNAAPLLESLNAGAIDSGLGGDAAFIFALGAGSRIKAIGAQHYEGGGPVIVVRGDAPQRRVDQIAGLRIATPRGSIGHNLALAALEAAGKPLDAAHFAFLSPADGEAALRNGSVDAWAIWDPNAAIAVRHGARLLTGSEGLVASYTLEFASDGALARKRPLLADFRHRLYAGWRWALDNQDRHAALLAGETGVPVEIWRDMARRSRRVPVPITPELVAAQQKTADRYVRAHLLEKPIDVAHGFDGGFGK